MVDAVKMISRDRAPGSTDRRSAHDRMILDNLRALFRSAAEKAWRHAKGSKKIPLAPARMKERPINPDTGKPYDVRDPDPYIPCPVPVEKANGEFEPCGYEPENRGYGIQVDAMLHMENCHFAEWCKEETPDNEFRSGWLDTDGKLRPPAYTIVKLPYWGQEGDDPGRTGLEQALYEAKNSPKEKDEDAQLIAQADEVRNDSPSRGRGRPKKEE